MISYSSAPIEGPAYIDVTPGGDIVELGRTDIRSDYGAFYDSETRPSLGVYDNSGRLTDHYYAALPFRLTKENVTTVTQTINFVRQLLFLNVPVNVIRAGFAANVKPESPDSLLQYKVIDLL